MTWLIMIRGAMLPRCSVRRSIVRGWGRREKAKFGFIVLRCTGYNPIQKDVENFIGKFIAESYIDLAYTKWQNKTLGLVDGRYVDVSEELLKTLAVDSGIKSAAIVGGGE